MLIAVDKFSALELCDRGQYEAAGESLGIRAGERPENVSGSQSEQGMTLLVAGIISSRGGRIQSTLLGIEMLKESIELFVDGPLSHVARYWLAWAEYSAGESDKALDLVAEILAAPVGDVSRFTALLLRAVVYTDQDLDAAWAELEQMMPFYESCDDLRKGKFHNQRGRILRMNGETDRAVVEYDSAIHFFTEADDICYQAVASNNLAGVYLEIKEFDRASVYAEQSRVLFHKLGDQEREAQASDQTALILLAKAEHVAMSGSSLVGAGKTLRECEKTLGKIKRAQALYLQHDNDTLQRRSHPPTTLPRESRPAMTPYDCALDLVQGNPTKAETLLDLLYWVASDQGDHAHEAELDGIYETLHAKTEDGIKHRKAHRSSRLIRPVT